LREGACVRGDLLKTGFAVGLPSPRKSGGPATVGKSLYAAALIDSGKWLGAPGVLELNQPRRAAMRSILWSVTGVSLSLLMFPLGLLLCGLSFIPGSPQLFGVAEFFLGTLLPFLPLSVVLLILVLVGAVPRTGRVPPPIQRGDRL
jgi:hypothetical protein